MVRARFVAAALGALVAGRAHAQIVEKKVLTLEGARRAIAAAEAEARRNKAGGIIAVVDDGGNLMALERLEGTFAAGARVSIGKARTAALFKKPTRFFEELNNKVHASHRDGAGKAEVHLRDTDIIHVLHGKATLVTGGTVLEGQTIEPDEIRGAGLQGGDTRHLAEGDVVVVPSGVPHWFQQA